MHVPFSALYNLLGPIGYAAFCIVFVVACYLAFRQR
jgi:hypothetical protein